AGRRVSCACRVGGRDSVAGRESHMSASSVRCTIAKNLGSRPNHEILKEVYDTLIYNKVNSAAAPVFIQQPVRFYNSCPVTSLKGDMMDDFRKEGAWISLAEIL